MDLEKIDDDQYFNTKPYGMQYYDTEHKHIICQTFDLHYCELDLTKVVAPHLHEEFFAHFNARVPFSLTSTHLHFYTKSMIWVYDIVKHELTKCKSNHEQLIPGAHKVLLRDDFHVVYADRAIWIRPYPYAARPNNKHYILQLDKDREYVWLDATTDTVCVVVRNIVTNEQYYGRILASNVHTSVWTSLSPTADSYRLSGTDLYSVKQGKLTPLSTWITPPIKFTYSAITPA